MTSAAGVTVPVGMGNDAPLIIPVATSDPFLHFFHSAAVTGKTRRLVNNGVSSFLKEDHILKAYINDSQLT